VTPSRLLIRPRWIEGESWSGYLLRLANGNQMPGIKSIGRLLGVPFRSLLIEQPKPVLRALGFGANGVPAVQFPTSRVQPSRAGPNESLRGVLMTRGRRLDAAVCPHCLAGDETPHVRAVWERPLDVGCRVHGTQLLTRCTSCGMSLRVDRPQLSECLCGAPLAAQAVPKLEVPWTAIPYAFNVVRGKPYKETFQPTSLEELVATSVVERLAVYERQHAPAPRKRRVSAKASVEDLQLAAPWFQNWPSSFERRYTEALGLGRIVGDDLRTSYIQAKTLFAPMFPRLHSVVRRVGRERRFQPRHSLQLSVDDLLSCAQLPVDSAMKLLGISRAQVWWLFTTGNLPGARQVSDLALSIPTEAVLDLMAQFSETEDWQAAADRRGLTHRAMKQVLRTGLLPAISLGDYGASRVSPHAWDEFGDLLLATARRLPARLSKSSVRLEAVIAASHQISPDPSRTAQILAAIGNGTLAVYKQRSAPRKLNELLISLIQLKKVAPRHG
jgi:hypothetical protein